MVTTMDLKEIIDLILEEYKLLREESLQAMRNMYAIMTFGLATLGVVFHAGINSFSKASSTSPAGYWLSLLIFLGIPALSLSILSLWYSEAARGSRVGVYLKERETLINLLTGPITENMVKNNSKSKADYPRHFKKTIWWESYIREKVTSEKTRQLVKFRYRLVFSIFIGVAVVSMIIANFPIQSLGFPKTAHGGINILGFGLIIMIARHLVKKGKELK